MYKAKVHMVNEMYVGNFQVILWDAASAVEQNKG